MRDYIEILYRMPKRKPSGPIVHYLIKLWVSKETIGIIKIPKRIPSWIVFHDKSTSTYAALITSVEYETYEVFGFPVFQYSEYVTVAVGATVYDPKYFKITEKDITRIPCSS